MKPKQTLALLQHQINWWEQDGNFNLSHFEKVMEAKEFKKAEAPAEDTFIFHSIFSKPNRNAWDNSKLIRFHKV